MKYDEKYEDELPVKSSGKGFYIALAVCLVAVCGVAVATFVDGISAKTPVAPTTKATAPTTAVQQVVIPATDVKDERTTTTATTPSTAAPTTTAMAPTTDLFVFPSSNRVSAPYSEELVYSETLGNWGTHNGVDFAAEAGSAVKAAADGVVTRIYRDALWGDVIEIDHGGKVLSRCCGAVAKGIKEGDTVKLGDVIGAVSEIPAEITEPPHLHFEVLANDKYVDPLLLIRAETVAVTE